MVYKLVSVYNIIVIFMELFNNLITSNLNNLLINCYY